MIIALDYYICEPAALRSAVDAVVESIREESWPLLDAELAINVEYVSWININGALCITDTVLANRNSAEHLLVGPHFPCFPIAVAPYRSVRADRPQQPQI